MYKIETLLRSSYETSALVNGKYVPARPIPFQSWKYRLSDAWEVLLGRADAVKWEGQ